MIAEFEPHRRDSVSHWNFCFGGGAVWFISHTDVLVIFSLSRLEVIQSRIDFEKADETVIGRIDLENIKPGSQKDEKALEGLQLLYKRLKKEFDKMKSTPSLR